MPAPTLTRSYSEGEGGGVGGIRNLARGALRPKMRGLGMGGGGAEDLWGEGGDAEGDGDGDGDGEGDDEYGVKISTGFEREARRKRLNNVAAASNKSYTWKTKLISCGSNHSCQLGYAQKGGKKNPLPQDPFSTVLKEVGLNGASCSHVTSVAVGGSVTFITNVNNEVWAWGSGPLGGGGGGKKEGGYAGGVSKSMTAVSNAWNGVSASPKKLVFCVNISLVTAGPSHAIALSINGTCFSWGNGSDGRLGHGDNHNRAVPTKLEVGVGCVFEASCGERHTMIVVDESGKGGGYVPPAGSEEARELKGVRTGTLMSFGSNKGGQLGTGDIVNRLSPSVVTCSAWRRGAMVTSVSCGMHHTLAIAVVGNSHPVKRRVYAWGWGEHGRLGVGHDEMQVSPTEVALMSHRNVLSVKAGEQHSLAMTENGDVYSWGSNRFGQLGLGLDGETLLSNPLPQKVVMGGGELAECIGTGSRHSSVVSRNGKVLLWGWGEEGQLGNGVEMNSDAPSVVDVPDVIGEAGKIGKVVGIGLGLSHTVILVENVKKVSAEYIVEEVKEVEKVVEKEVVREKVVEVEEERRRKQKEFAKKMMEQAKQAEIEFEAKEARALQQQRAKEQRRKSEASTLAKFEERKVGMKKKEEVVVKKVVQIVLEKKVEVGVVEEPVMVLEEMRSGDSDSMTTTSREESIETSEDSRKENIISVMARPKSPNNVQFAQKMKYDQIYYHPDQPVEKCFVANAARRAMMRSISRKKAEGKKKFQKRITEKKEKGERGGGGGGGGGGVERSKSSSILRRSSYG
ncbi:hypothetical protein TrLO_g2013 [Triparma laevis f. longispina]|uniref:RCC1-like domain-containing protein n=1 Tax=Triparma laevis f. longispina TaxID=1714387 RepID=A0A9W6ZGR6_9STRA|nr:hypothetical protein TrLO_g2013 [Triparma laevis f. longispina]